MSDLPLPLAPIEDLRGPDLVVCFDGIVPRPEGPHPRRLQRTWRRQDDGWLLRFWSPSGHLLDFLYDPTGTRISIRQSYPQWEDSLFVLLCTAMAAALWLRAIPVLHATSLVIDGRACLLMGASGAGKSTLAASLVAEGMSLHADDVAALRWEDGRPFIEASYPRLKITPEAAEALELPASILLPIFATEPWHAERWWDVSARRMGFHDGPAPLSAVYLLGRRTADQTAPRLESLTPGRAVLAVTRHFYGDLWLDHPPLQVIDLCSRLAATAVVRRLRMPDRLESLRNASRLVIAHMASVGR